MGLRTIGGWKGSSDEDYFRSVESFHVKVALWESGLDLTCAGGVEVGGCLEKPAAQDIVTRQEKSDASFLPLPEPQLHIKREIYTLGSTVPCMYPYWSKLLAIKIPQSLLPTIQQCKSAQPHS